MSDSKIWNAHTISEIRANSLMDKAYFNEKFGSFFVLCGVDEKSESEDMKNGISKDGIVPKFIQYKNNIYAAKIDNEPDASMIYRGFDDSEPEIITQNDDSIVFRRTNMDGIAFEFSLSKDSDGEWKTTSVTKLDTESENPEGEELSIEEVSEIVIDNAKKYFDLEKFIYGREASESDHIILKSSTEDNGTDELEYCKVEDLDDDYYEIYGTICNAHSIAELREGSCITDELFERRYSECFGEVNGDTVNTEFCLPRFIEYNGALYLSADYDASSYDIRVSGVPEIIISSPDKIVGRIPVIRHFYNEEEFEITYEITLIKNTEGEGWLTSDVENVNPAESSDETETNVKAVVKKYYDYEKYIFSKESFDYSKEVVYYCGDKTEENTMKYVPFKDADWNTVEKYEAQEAKFLGYIPERDIMDCSEYPSGHVFETDGADYLLPRYITIDGILYRLEEENPYVYDNIGKKIADAEVELCRSDCAKVEITLDIKPSVKEKLTDSDRIKDKFEFWIKYENGEWKLEYKLNTTS